jgi:3-hydroxy-D-aspartate aldolase
MTDLAAFTPFYDIPALPGWMERQIATPALILDADALGRNVARMQAVADAAGIALRPHGKMHKSAHVARLQIAAGAVGICAQKVSEAEAFRRAGISDILVTNEVRGAERCARLAALARSGPVAACVDDADGVAELSAAAVAAGVTMRMLVEIDTGQGRCGVTTPDAAVALARAVTDAPGLTFGGLQAYQGDAQHIADPAERARAVAASLARTRAARDAILASGLPCTTVTGAGTGSFADEAASGIYTELQCGSYAFMDAHYARVLGPQGFEHALFLLTSVISKTRPGMAVCDAGLKVTTAESGLPRSTLPGVTYTAASDEHGTLDDPGDRLRVGDRLRLIPGHCDPTCNLHDWYAVLRGDVVEALWPVTARGRHY